MNKFVNIEGNQININSIISVSKINCFYGMGSYFKPLGTYTFRVEYGINDCIYVRKHFRIGMFSDKPKSQIDKDTAFRKITQKRNEILSILGITE